MRRLISSGSSFEAEGGYSRAVADGDWVFVAGTTGFYYARMTIADDPAEQARQAFRNIAAALAEAGATLADVVRVRYYVPDIADWPAIMPDRWLADFEQIEIKPEVRPLILKQNAAKLLGLG